jgi:GH15 family glucan-1,4-alpha-glucosidase
MSYQPIENYGIIGDLQTVALVGMDGSIDFMAFPSFDSPTIFAALLDDKKGGRFQLSPVLPKAKQKQLYLPDSNVLLTRFLAEEGVAEISDYMPIGSINPTRDLVRRVKTVKGELHYRMVFEPRFDYGRGRHRVEQKEHEVLFIHEGRGEGCLRLRSEIPVRLVEGAAVAEFVLNAGETAAFVLEEAQPGEESPSSDPDYVPNSFKQTLNFWRNWISQSNYQGRWREMVNRAALTLKLLVSQPHGSIVAAPTFALPELVGGVRNWDYRYTWIRDASFTLYALIRLGYTGEAEAFMRWMEARCEELEPDGSLKVLYRIDGKTPAQEEILDHLEGYCQTSPVRIGNNAFGQLQLDIYGELMDSVYLYDKFGQPISHDFWSNLTRLVDWVCENWDQPDEGIWEIRNKRQEFLFSRVMCWVAVDRGIRLAQKRSFPAPLARWHGVRNSIYQDVFANFWDPGQKAFVQCKGSKYLDAASLLLPLIKFISPRDPRFLSHLRAVEQALVSDSLVYRHNREDLAFDGLQGLEGTFSMCSFWYVECLCRSGDLEKARFFFEKMLGYANHLGLYSEELGLRGEHLGNFPQAFTHLALISAAYALDRRLSAAGQQA